MRILRDLSVRGKLIAGFGAVLALTAIVGTLLVVELRTVNAGGHYVGRKQLPTVVAIATLKADAIDLRRAQLDFLINNDPLTAQEELDDWQADAQWINGQLVRDAHAGLSGRNRALFESFRSDWAAYQAGTANLEQIGASNVDPYAVASLADETDETFAALKQTADQWMQVNVQLAGQKVDSNQSTYSTALVLAIVLLLLAIAVGIGIASVTASSIKSGVDIILERISSLQTRCVTFVREGLQAFAAGDLTQRYESATPEIPNPGKDEIGQVAAAVNGIREQIIFAIEAYNETAQVLSGTMERVAASAGAVSAASLQMAATSEETGRATGEVAHAVTDIASGAERQVRMVESARDAAEQVAQTVVESAAEAQRTAEVVIEARGVAERGVDAAEQANEAMRSVRESSTQVTSAIRDLAAKSGQIGQIVETITGIAQQTNLLALNAAIEAARAGEQGRGFAVVAEEVRKLAEGSQEAAAEIAQLIGAIQSETSRTVTVVEQGAQRTHDGAAVVEQTREAFLQIGDAVRDVTDRIQHIAGASDRVAGQAQRMQESIGEVAAVAEQSSASTEEASATTEQAAASSQQIAASAQQLAGTAQELAQLMAQFRTGV